jgi:hypothetical protein
MPLAYPDGRTFLAALFGKAEELRGILKSMRDVEQAKLITEIVRDSDMVFGVWPSQNDHDGFGIQIIKGEANMPPFECFERDDELRIAAIPCVGLEQALAARDEWGKLFDVSEEQPLQYGRR